MKRKLMAGAALTILLTVAGVVAWKWSELGGQSASWWRLVRTETGGTPHYDPIQYRDRDSRAAITNPVFLAASEVKMAGGTMGIGVAIGDEAKFYPLTVLSYHQVVNDSCGGKKIACTY